MCKKIVGSRLIYKTSFAKENSPIPFEIVAAFLRMGNKYGLSDLEHDARKRLFHEYPARLPDFDLCQMGELITPEPGIHFKVANLAVEQELPSVLPSTLYRGLTELSTTSIAEACSMAIHVLCDINQRTCITATGHWCEKVWETTLGWAQDPWINECDDLECTRGKCRFLLEAPQLKGLETWRKEWDKMLCKGCRWETRQKYVKGRQRF